MTTMVLNIDNVGIIPSLQRVLNSIPGVSIAQTASSERTDYSIDSEKESFLSEISMVCEDIKRAKSGSLKGKPIENLLNDI